MRPRPRGPGLWVGGALGLAAVLVAVHFWSHTWSPTTGDLAREVTEVVPDDWDLVDESEHVGDLFRFCIDETCPRVVHQYLASIDPGRFTAELELRLADAGYTVVVEDDPGGCRLPANVSPESSFPLCQVVASGDDAELQFVAFSPAVADRRFPAESDGSRHLIAIEATSG